VIWSSIILPITCGHGLVGGEGILVQIIRFGSGGHGPR